LISVCPYISFTVTPSASLLQPQTASPTVSPALMIERSARSYFSAGCGTAFIIIFSAVGKRKLLLTPYFSISQKAFSGSKRPR
jgi:hypothetical protein